MLPQNDPKNHPIWQGENAAFGASGCRYPKMLLTVATEKDRADWLARNAKKDTNTGQVFYDELAPRPGALVPLVSTPEMVAAGLATVPGQDVVVEDAETEARILEFIGGRIEPANNNTIAIPIAQPIIKKSKHRKKAAAPTENAVA
jgi:hypothetical protein